MMKPSILRTVLSSLLLIFLLFLTNAPAFSQVSIGADLAYKSKYVWRGIPFNSEAVFWPDAWLNWNGFTFVFFGSQELTDIYGNQNKFTEVDYYLDYSRAFGKINTTLGYAHYTYPNTDFKSTGELYLKAGTDFGWFSGLLSAYFDLIEANGFYLSPQLKKSFDLSPITPTISASFGYGDKKHNGYWTGWEEGALLDVTAGLSISYSPGGKLGEFMSLSADLNYSFIADSDIANLYGDDDSNFWFGLALNFFTTLGGE